MQGQSAVTADKERRIASAISLGMRVASGRFGGRGFNYWHFDANAGSGWNDKSLGEGVPGSPLVFWQVARECLSGLKPVPWFCDREESAITGLRQRLSADASLYGDSVIQCGDNEDGLECFAEYIRRSRESPARALGSVIVDPNGYFYRSAEGSGAPVKALPEFCREFERIDVILNMNIRAYAMQAAQKHSVEPPQDVMASLYKKHWLVAWAGRENARFLLVIGRNFPTGDHKKIGMFDSESPEGKSILNRARGGRQGALDVPVVPGISLSSGIQGYPRGSDAQSRREVPMWSDSDRGPPHQIPFVGDIRHTDKPAPDLSSLPLFGGRKE